MYFSNFFQFLEMVLDNTLSGIWVIKENVYNLLKFMPIFDMANLPNGVTSTSQVVNIDQYQRTLRRWNMYTYTRFLQNYWILLELKMHELKLWGLLQNCSWCFFINSNLFWLRLFFIKIYLFYLIRFTFSHL